MCAHGKLREASGSFGKLREASGSFGKLREAPGRFGKLREAIRYGVLLHVAEHRRHLRFMPRLRLPMKEGCVGSGWMQGIATQAHTKQEARPGPERVR